MEIRVGQIWKSRDTGNLWQVVKVDLTITVVALGGRHVGDNICTFNARIFTENMLKLIHDGPWTREELRKLTYLNRPRVRVRYGSDESSQEIWADVVPDNGKVWVVVFSTENKDKKGVQVEVTYSWNAVLEVLNNPSAAPLWVEKKQ